MTNDDEAEWLPLVIASQRLGMSIDAMRSRVRRGTLPARRGNDGKVLVRVSTRAGELVGEVAATRLDQGGDQGRDHALAELHRDLRAAIERAARAEGELVGERRVTGVMEAELAELRARLERAEMSWWRRFRRR